MLTVTKSRVQLRYIQVIFTLLKWNEKNLDFMAIRETKKAPKTQSELKELPSPPLLNNALLNTNELTFVFKTLSSRNNELRQN
jgi:hypothetical protein